MNINAFEVDASSELAGIWKEIGPDASVKVARVGNSAYRALLRELMSPYRTAAGINSLSPERSDEILIKVIAETILLNWKGLIDDDETEVEYSVETALKWLTKYKEFRRIIIIIAEDINNYRVDVISEVKEDIKK